MNEKRIELELSKHPEKYSGHYSADKFLHKISKLTRKKSLDVVIHAFILYYTIKAPTTPKWVILEIVPSLGYFVLPLDLVPDFLLGIGLTDDFAAIGITFGLMTGTIRGILREFSTPEILINSLNSTKKIFKNVPEEEIRAIINKLELYDDPI